MPALTDANHAQQAVRSGLAILRATGHSDVQPWIPVGVGVNSGVAYVGAVGTDEHVEFTALGDAVNVAARLSAAAGSGELLTTTETLRAAGWDAADLPARRLELKGRSEPVEARALRLGTPVS